MINHLYAHFLDDPEDYRRSEEFWTRLCRDVIKYRTSTDDWSPWLTTAFADGTPFADGNPICNLMSPGLRRGIRIIQQPVSSQEPTITAFTEDFGHNPDEDEYVIELVVVCELSDESAKLARSLIAEWVGIDTDVNSFDSVIARILAT